MEELEKSEVEPEKFNIESHDPESSHMSDYSSVPPRAISHVAWDNILITLE